MAKQLRNDPDRKMFNCSIGGQVFMTEADIRALDPRGIGDWIEELRKSETMTRRLRQRLEALQGRVEKSCPVCGRPVAGRADAVYCTSNCRSRAHRANRASGPTT